MVDILGRENVGMITETPPSTEAPVICCTAEILIEPGPARAGRVEGGLRGDGRVPLYADPDRGWACGAAAHAAECAVLPMSATLGDVSDIAAAA